MKRLFLLELALLFAGIVCGITGYVVLPESQIMLTEQYMADAMRNLSDITSSGEVAMRIFSASIEDMLRFFLAGLCLVGIPVILLLLFLKGFSIGFAACFLVQHSVILLLPRLFYLPVLVLAAGLGIRFSGAMLQNQISSPVRHLMEYTVMFGVLLCLLLAVSFADGFCCVRYLNSLK